MLFKNIMNYSCFTGKIVINQVKIFHIVLHFEITHMHVIPLKVYHYIIVLSCQLVIVNMKTYITMNITQLYKQIKICFTYRPEKTTDKNNT